MELFPFDEERVAHLAAHDHDQDFRVLLVYIVEDAEITESEFIASQRVWLEPLDGPTGGRGLTQEAGGDSLPDDALLPGR
jgi:hypothetical protein